MTREEETKEFAQAMSRYVNGMRADIPDVVDILARDHRTIQQSVTRFAVMWLEKMAEHHDNQNFDLRNQASVELGKEFVEKVSYEARKGIPLI